MVRDCNDRQRLSTTGVHRAAVLNVLVTARLRLEPLVGSHSAELFGGLQSADLYEYIDEAAPTDVDALRRRYEALERRTSPDGSQDWLNWAAHSVPEQRYVGYVQATVHRDGTADVAYVLFRDAWGRGYGQEAVAAMCAHLQAEHDVDLLRATVDAENERSRTLLTRLGFVSVPRRCAG